MFLKDRVTTPSHNFTGPNHRSANGARRKYVLISTVAIAHMEKDANLIIAAPFVTSMVMVLSVAERLIGAMQVTMGVLRKTVKTRTQRLIMVGTGGNIMRNSQ